MTTLIIIIVYLIGIFIFGYIQYKQDKEISYFCILSWIGIVILLFTYSVDKINEKLNNNKDFYNDNRY